jgi:nucleotide-binding universal stress UspA family protein
MNKIEMRHILYATDFSPSSTRAFEHALVLSVWYQAPLTVLHVLPCPLVALHAAAYPGRSLPEGSLRETVHARMASLAGPASAAGVQAVAEVREGHPTSEIVRMARELGADLIVMGTHGRVGPERWALGSVAETVLRRAPCPVLTVPPRAEDDPDPLFFKRILCATDFSPAAETAVRYASALAAEADASLFLVHVIDPQGGPHPETGDDGGGEPPAFECAARARLRRAVPPEAREWCHTRETVARGRAAPEILRLAAEERAGLIVMGVHGRGLLDLMAFGSVTHEVVREAACPVLTVRSPSR